LTGDTVLESVPEVCSVLDLDRLNPFRPFRPLRPFAVAVLALILILRDDGAGDAPRTSVLSSSSVLVGWPGIVNPPDWIDPGERLLGRWDGLDWLSSLETVVEDKRCAEFVLDEGEYFESCDLTANSRAD
jgi:hypothetical protein